MHASFSPSHPPSHIICNCTLNRYVLMQAWNQHCAPQGWFLCSWYSDPLLYTLSSCAPSRTHTNLYLLSISLPLSWVHNSQAWSHIEVSQFLSMEIVLCLSPWLYLPTSQGAVEESSLNCVCYTSPQIEMQWMFVGNFLGLVRLRCIVDIHENQGVKWGWETDLWVIHRQKDRVTSRCGRASKRNWPGVTV